MAFLDPKAVFADGAAAVPVPADVIAGLAVQDVVDAPTTGFSALEWTVISLARQDRLSSLGKPGPLARLLARLFGIARPSALADPRLEALRRMAVHAWHQGYRLPVSQTKAFLAAGFSADQFDTLLASIVAKRAQPRRRAYA
jgi:hypothetical protein